MTVSYEWDIETSDEHGDIEHDFLDGLAHLPPLEAGQELVLVREMLNEFGSVEDRQWAYAFDGKLPEVFDGGIKVPKKFAREFASSDFAECAEGGA